MGAQSRVPWKVNHQYELARHVHKPPVLSGQTRPYRLNESGGPSVRHIYSSTGLVLFECAPYLQQHMYCRRSHGGR